MGPAGSTCYGTTTASPWGISTTDGFDGRLRLPAGRPPQPALSQPAVTERSRMLYRSLRARNLREHFVHPVSLTSITTGIGRDLLVVRSSGPWLFLKQGDGTFRLKPNAFRFAQTPQGTFTVCCCCRLRPPMAGWTSLLLLIPLPPRLRSCIKYPLPYHDAQNGLCPNFLMPQPTATAPSPTSPRASLRIITATVSAALGATTTRTGGRTLYVCERFR